jgi:hypothetical protein
LVSIYNGRRRLTQSLPENEADATAILWLTKCATLAEIEAYALKAATRLLEQKMRVQHTCL